MITVLIDTYTAHNERKMRDIIIPALIKLAIDSNTNIEVKREEQSHIVTLVGD